MDWNKWLRWMGYCALASCVQLAVKPGALWWFPFATLALLALPVAGLVWIDGLLARRQRRKVGHQ